MKFKVGDKVKFIDKYQYISAGHTGEIIEIYNDGYKIVCDCGFKFSENFSDEELVKHEPIIVFNDVDPFGEEDWSE